MVKKILLILILLFFSGCTANYTLEIDKNMIFKENISIVEDSSVLSTYTNNVDLFIEDYLYSYTVDEDYNYYFFNYINNQNGRGVNASYIYLDFNEYVTKNQIIKEIMKEVNILNNKNKVTLEFVLEDKIDILESTEINASIIDEIKFKVYLPYKVLRSNSDFNNDNYYSWILNEQNSKNTFYIEFDNSKMYRKKNNVSIIYIVFALAIIGIAFVIYKIVKKYKENSEF